MSNNGALHARFWSRVRVTGSPADCWEWTGAKQSGKWKYGRLSVDGQWTAAHRLAWTITNDASLEPGQVVRHICDNPPCVNPAHLEVGTFADNTADMHRRGRRGDTARPGELNGSARLDSASVRSMREDRDRLGMSWAALGDKYSISKAHARRVCLKINWKAAA